MTTSCPIDRAVLDAIRNGDARQVSEYLRGGLDPNAVDATSEFSLVMLAAEYDAPTVIDVLLKAGADVNLATSSGWTALHHAVDLECDAKGQAGPAADFRLVGPLLHAGADVEAVWNPARGPETSIRLAAGYGWEAGRHAMSAVAGRPSFAFVVRECFTVTAFGTTMVGFSTVGSAHTGQELEWVHEDAASVVRCRGIMTINRKPLRNPPDYGIAIADVAPDDVAPGDVLRSLS